MVWISFLLGATAAPVDNKGKTRSEIKSAEYVYCGRNKHMGVCWYYTI